MVPRFLTDHRDNCKELPYDQYASLLHIHAYIHSSNNDSNRYSVGTGEQQGYTLEAMYFTAPIEYKYVTE